MDATGAADPFRLSPLTGEFTEPATEHEFRAASQVRRVRVLRFVAVAGALFFLVAGLGDWLAPQRSPHFATLIALRLLILVPAGAVLYASRRPEQALRLDGSVLVFALWLSSTGAYFMTLGTEDMHYYLPSALVLVLVFLLVVPFRLLFALASALYATGLFLLVAGFRLDPTPQQMIQGTVLLSACIVLGAYVQRTQQMMARREFARLRELETANRRLAEEIQARQQTGAALEQRLRFEELLVRLTTGFINVDGRQLDKRISAALAELGEHSDADRCYVFRLDATGNRFSCTHEWCAAGVKPILPVYQSLSVRAFSWGMPRLLRGEILAIPRVAGLPAEAYAERQEFERHDTRAVLLVPLFHDRHVTGFIGLGAVHAEHEWPEECSLLLRIVGHALAGALHRQPAAPG
jgi:hypothetical protein